MEPAYGHTAGHSLLRLVSSEREAYFVGDAFHHPVEIVYPQINAGTCENFETTQATRKRLLHTCAQKQALMVPAHFPLPFGGYVTQAGSGYAFEALAIPA